LPAKSPLRGVGSILRAVSTTDWKADPEAIIKGGFKGMICENFGLSSDVQNVTDSGIQESWIHNSSVSFL
jgi:hypothetical protein